LPDLSLQDPDDEQSLIRLLMSYQARTGKRVTVVFDPGVHFSLPSSLRSGKVEVVFAPQGSTADDVISRRVHKSRHPAGLQVVTSDQRLLETVTRQGARVRRAEEFAAELGPQREVSPGWKEGTLSPDQVDAWLAEFGEQKG
jgi:predicted RNA-binding protein with PIN domain